MQRLITPERVVELAFSEGEFLPRERISEPQILVAEERYLLPIVGQTLYEALGGGEYSEFCKEYVEPLLAYAVKSLLLPELRVWVGACGVAEPSGEGWESASEESFSTLLAGVKSHLKSLRRRLSRALEREHEAGRLPLYEPKANILNRCRIDGGFVQIL